MITEKLDKIINLLKGASIDFLFMLGRDEYHRLLEEVGNQLTFETVSDKEYYSGIQVLRNVYITGVWIQLIKD